MFRACVAAIIVSIVLFVGGTAQAKRIAFVVGVDSYDNLKPDQQLRKAINDARAMSDTLGSIGFQVYFAENASRLDFLKSWQHFIDAVHQGDTTAFYFAGHGFEIGGNNYLLLRDVPDIAEGEDIVKDSSISVTALMERLSEQRSQVSIFIIDACRNNPFGSSLATRGIAATRGLSRVDPPNGTFVMMSAGAGQEALDSLSPSDTSKNSVYTRTLLPLLRTPGLEITDVAKKVRSRVEALAAGVHHDQRPAFYYELSGDFFLVERNDLLLGDTRSPNVQLDAALPRDRAVAPQLDQDDNLDAVWASTRNTKSKAVLEAFLRAHSDSPYAKEAHQRLDFLTHYAVATAVPRGMSAAPVTPPAARAATPLDRATEKSLQPHDVFKECVGCPDMVVVAGGSFTMGSPENEPGRYLNEGPQHLVTLKHSFAAGRFAVTFDEWDQCVAAKACRPLTSPVAGPRHGAYPVVEVSFDEANTYVSWLAETTGKPYRLLSEAEREYAARAGTSTPFWWGTSPSPQQANYKGTQPASGTTLAWSQPVPVDSFSANAFGLYQVNGNVSEWVEDCFHGNYVSGPDDGSAWVSGECARRVVRGGSWFDDPTKLRAASRSAFVPDYRDSTIGFRVARAIAQ